MLVITFSLAVRDRSIQEGGLFKRVVLSRAYGTLDVLLSEEVSVAHMFSSIFRMYLTCPAEVIVLPGILSR